MYSGIYGPRSVSSECCPPLGMTMFESLVLAPCYLCVFFIVIWLYYYLIFMLLLLFFGLFSLKSFIVILNLILCDFMYLSLLRFICFSPAPFIFLSLTLYFFFLTLCFLCINLYFLILTLNFSFSPSIPLLTFCSLHYNIPSDGVK